LDLEMFESAGWTVAKPSSVKEKST
jgi:hypothetical protein